jgi:hypothetical protein
LGREREGAPVRVSSKGGAPFIEGGFVLAEERDFGDSRYWVFLAGV